MAYDLEDWEEQLYRELISRKKNSDKDLYSENIYYNELYECLRENTSFEFLNLIQDKWKHETASFAEVLRNSLSELNRIQYDSLTNYYINGQDFRLVSSTVRLSSQTVRSFIRDSFRILSHKNELFLSPTEYENALEWDKEQPKDK